MSLPFRRRSRPKGAARLAPVPDIPDTSEADTEQWLSQIITGHADGTTWPPPASDQPAVIFAGANDIGLMPEGAGEAGRDTQPPAMLRTQPPPSGHAGYAATTGPQPAYVRLAPAIGDALTRDDHWGRKLIPLPCGHCGAPPEVPDGILERTKIIGYVNWLALKAGWIVDNDWIWTCPQCQQDEEWKARQGQMELHRFGQPCDRHDAPPWADVDPDECRCTCPAAVVAVDVMLASEDHLGSGRGRYTAGAS